jgi:hypothetical protein
MLLHAVAQLVEDLEIARLERKTSSCFEQVPLSRVFCTVDLVLTFHRLVNLATLSVGC